MKAEFALHSRKTLLPSGLAEAWVLVGGGKIVAVEPSAPQTIAVHELGDLTVMPGLIDSHVHINEPGRTDWEGFDTATKAAAAGGITTLVDMPLNSSPVTTRAAALAEKLDAAKGRLHVNCGFYGGLVPGNNADLKPLIEAGVLGIKAFLSHSGIDDFPNVTGADLRAGMPVIAKANIPLLVHAELVSDHEDIHLPAKFPRSHDAWLRSRPKDWENDAIALLIGLCRETNCKTHIVHLSSAESIGQLENAIAEGLPMTVETCPHYLVFSAEDIADGQTVFKCAPPIRERENNSRLWEALGSGLITMVVTDHSPATPSLKGLETGNFAEAWGGIASLQFSLPATWTKARELGFGIEDIAAWMSGNVARFLGIGHDKGKIAVGHDADLVVWDPESSFVADAGDIHHRHKISPYVGGEYFGVVQQTWVNGRLVYDSGDFPNLNCGKIVLRKT